MSFPVGQPVLADTPYPQTEKYDPCEVLAYLGIERFTRDEYQAGFKQTWGRDGRNVVLGQGTFGVVYLHRDQRECAGPGVFVATKIPKAGRTQDPMQELVYQAVLADNFPHVVSPRGWIVGDGDGGPSPVADSQRVAGIICELCRETLASGLNKAQHMFPPRTQVKVLKGIGRGLAHIHDFGVLHGDLTPCNVMLSDDVDTGLVAKISDFGSSVRLRGRPQPATRFRSPAGTWPPCLSDSSGCPECMQAATAKDETCTWTYR